jgi:undecaprenyl-diphosphatase
VFLGLSLAGSLGAVWLIIAALIAFARRDPWPALLTLLAVAVADLAATAVKVLTDRPRPYVAHPEQEPLDRATLELSLPSGHAATSFAAAVVLARFAPRWATPFLFVLAALIAWSRVYVGVHYPTDVLLGALLGAAVGLLVLAAPRWVAARSRRGEP